MNPNQNPSIKADLEKMGIVKNNTTQIWQFKSNNKTVHYCVNTNEFIDREAANLMSDGTIEIKKTELNLTFLMSVERKFKTLLNVDDKKKKSLCKKNKEKAKM